MGSLKALNKYFFKHKNKLIPGLIFILCANLFQVTIPIFVQQSIDQLNDKIDYSILLQNTLLIIGAALISGLFRFLIRMTINVVSREIEFDLRHDFWAHIQKLALRYFQNNSTGNIMAHATNDISAVRMYVGPAIMYSVDTITRFILVISIMLSYSPLLTFYTLIPLPLLSIFVYKLSKRIHKMFTKIQEKFSELTTKAQENFSGIRVIKSYVREKSEIESFKKLSDEYLKKNMAKVRIQALFMPLLFLITGTSIIIVIWAGGSMVINDQLSIGDIAAFMIYLGLLIWPTIAFGWVLNLIQQSSASMKRLNTIFNEDVEIKDSEDTKFDINSISGDIEFKDVSFKYKKDLPNILENINLKLPKGSTTAIIGHTGVGKSSLINFITRLYDVTEGSVLIDGNDIKQIPLKILRQNIGLVTQETFLFSDTLSNNILYGGMNGDKEILDKVSEISMLSKDIEQFPGGYETVLGERGITLSGGQKQRACLARALAVNPKILILDDSFSAVDTHTEEQILYNLKEFMKDRTSIIISHRISTVKNADKIIVLDNGKIVETGTHDELVVLGGIYTDLHYKQLLEEELKEMN